MRHGFLAPLIVCLTLGVSMLSGGAAQAANPAETFVADNVQKGLTILNDKHLSTSQRRSEFETFLVSLTDLHRIAAFTLGQYKRTASPADLEAFDAAFRNYAVAFYQSYFAKYTGQTLKVTGSQARASDDFVVQTVMIDPNDHSGQPPLEVDFHVRTNTGKPVVVDVAVLGIWVSLTEQNQFTAFLGQNNGSIPLLISHLNELTKGIH
ncbi:MAG TPA: ABC transporter substrate-binding protein [Rhizomicrobium sp.]